VSKVEQTEDKKPSSALPVISGVTAGFGTGAIAGYIMHKRQLSSVLKEKKISPEGLAAIERIVNADTNLDRIKTNIKQLTDIIGSKESISHITFTRGNDGKWNAEFRYFPEMNMIDSTSGSYRSRTLSIEDIHWDDLPNMAKTSFQDHKQDLISFTTTENLHDIFDKDIEPNFLRPMLKRSETHLDAQVENRLLKEMKLGFKDFNRSQKAKVVGSVVAATVVLGMSAYLTVQAITSQRKQPFVEREKERQAAMHNETQLVV
jgi:hypothetical protein